MLKLKDIDLTESQQNEIRDSLVSWKLLERGKIEQELTEKYEQMEADLQESNTLLIEELKDNMSKVYSKRFSNALKEMYREIKADVICESMQSPETKVFEEIKSLIYPLINESTVKKYTNEFVKLSEMYSDALEENELMKGSIKKNQLISSLSDNTREVVSALIGEGTQEEVVSKFSKIKEALNNNQEVDESSDFVDNSVYENEDDEPYNESINNDYDLSSRIDDDEDKDEWLNEDRDPSKEEFEKTLKEQLKLAGVSN